MKCLGVVVPCYNESASIIQILTRVLESPYVAEVIVVDDASHDDSVELARSIDDPTASTVIVQRENAGKGAALRRGFADATADYVIVQDADLRVRPGRLREDAPTDARREGRRCLRLAI